MHSGMRKALLGASVATLAMALSTQAFAQQRRFDIPAQDAASAVTAFGLQADLQISAPTGQLRGVKTPAVQGEMDARAALQILLAGTGLVVAQDDGRTIVLQMAPQGGSAAGGGAEVEALIVTAQKREEDIQDVPIAISAFTQEALERSQIAGGPDLITQIPNFSFTKTNFSSYSIQIRGIGTQAISATTDPAVAVAFNNTPFIRNRFFEQEFYDLERLEVLRGPQGTLYGRNATAGVVNIISAKPKFVYEAKASVDVGNYNATRLEGMVNIPLVEDVVALRLAGAWTKREGYAHNQFTGQQIDGRDLWSTRVSLRFEPTDAISANLIWEHFEEDDDRLRSGKQLCKKHIVDKIGNIPFTASGGGVFSANTFVSQGCTRTSLYSEEAFQTPNGYALPFYGPLGNIGNPIYINNDPYASTLQSRDLRVIESSVEPDYRAKTDIGEIQIAIDLTDSLTISSETSYSADSLFSLQDYNRFTTANGAFRYEGEGQGVLAWRPGLVRPDGSFCDPQLGCSDRLLLVDLSTANSTQFSQEFRLGSDFDGPFNFSLGVNYLRHDAIDKYYVFINSLSLFAGLASPSDPRPYIPGVTDNSNCQRRVAGSVGDTAPFFDPQKAYGIVYCTYIDPNPIGSLNDQGRNYFLSKNPYKLISYAAFGEIYYNLTNNLKVSGGFRFTVDRKTAPQIPSWLLVSDASGPYPVLQTVFQEWREPTGRVAVDWKPALSFTDETLIYASYAHGYKAGGANPPPPVYAGYADAETPSREILPDTFGPEFVDAFELGTKNTLFDGGLTLNLTAFYYDYEGYQTSEIRNRSAVNSNYDAEVWGLEVEADWRASDALRLSFKGGYNGTRIADGEKAIDLMDRTAGDPDWIALRPFPSVPSNCIIPVSVATAGGELHISQGGGSGLTLCQTAYYFGWDPLLNKPYDPSITDYTTQPAGFRPGLLGPNYADYEGFDPSTAPNGGRGIDKELGGNELPNAPNFTATVSADYTLPLAGDWLVNLHGDLHWQSESWWRVFNDHEYNKIDEFYTANLAAIFTNEDAGWKIMAYVKNVFDNDAITGAFLNSDDSGLTTNVFLTEPRLYGIRVTKDFTGGGWFGEIGRCDGECPLTVEVGGGVGRADASAQAYGPAWLDLYSAAVSIPDAFPDDSLDWGDMRSIKVAYAFSSGWRVSAAHRFGKMNSDVVREAVYEHVPGGLRAGIKYPFEPASYVAEPDNHWRSASRGAEEHEITDFLVGRDIGFGMFDSSTVALGLRRADLTSTSSVTMDGVPNRFVPPVAFPLDLTRPQRTRDAYTTTLDSERTFEGSGPMLAWDASVPLWRGDQQGHVNLDWTVAGGVLFGKQAVESRETRYGRYFESSTTQNPDVLYNDVVPISRTEDVTVPNLSLSLGFSYTVDRVKVSTGYSYDRFFDAIDGGYDEAKQYDRAIQGPYFKLSVGFGG